MQNDAPLHIDRLTRVLGVVALIGVATFTVICGAVQFLRTDYNWLGMPLSFYMIGPYGRIVQAGFFVLAAGLPALAVGWYRALERGARSAAPLLLFVIAAIALVINALELTDVPHQPLTFHGYVHLVAALVTFLCATVAMLLQAWRLRCDPRWRNRFGSAFTLAAIAFILLWIDALVKPSPRGLFEKILIVLILVWLWRAAWWLAFGKAS